jgi:hypothetical protein
MKSLYLLPIFILILGSCVSEPSFAVAPEPLLINGGDIVAGGDVEQNAIIYKGFDLFGQKCEAALTIFEENGEHVFAAKLYYQLHGEDLSDIELKAYKYDISSNTYNDTTTAAGSYALAGAYVRDVDSPVLNQLLDYENDGSLQYMLRLDLQTQNFETFEESLHTVIENPADFSK